MALVFSDLPCTAAALFTKNRFCAAPLLLNKKHLKGRTGQAILVNSGNANAATGVQGTRDATTMAKETARLLNIHLHSSYVGSTGVIGETLPMRKIIPAIPTLVSSLSTNGNHAAAEAILTTDTFRKETAWEGWVGNNKIRIGGMAKGSGMIHPNMATMLAFLSTDVTMNPILLQEGLREAVDHSFHRITVDGDTSTNDMVLLFANGKKGREIKTKGRPYREFVSLLTTACLSLAKLLVKDAEGATKLIEIRVTGAKDPLSAKKMCFSVAQSLLVKTAFFGEDPNWGRIIAAIGNAGAKVSLDRIDLYFGGYPLVKKGNYLGKGAETLIKTYLKKKELQLHVSFHTGQDSFTVWTNDLSYDYIKINASYRT